MSGRGGQRPFILHQHPPYFLGGTKWVGVEGNGHSFFTSIRRTPRLPTPPHPTTSDHRRKTELANSLVLNERDRV